MRTSPPRHAPANRTDAAPHRPRALTVFAAAFVAGAAAAVGVNRVLDVRIAQLKPRVESESIFVALRSLPQGSPVTVWDVALREWPKAMLPGTALRAQDSFAGMVLKHPLREGQPLLSVQLTPADPGRSSGEPTAAAAAPAFVQLQTPAAAPATTDLWTPAEPARPQPPAPQPPAPQPTPSSAVAETEKPVMPADTVPTTTPEAVPAVAGPTAPLTEPAGVPAAPPAADSAQAPSPAATSDAALAPQPPVAPESRPQPEGPAPQAAQALPVNDAEPRPNPAQAAPNAGGLAAETMPQPVTDSPAAAADVPPPEQAAVTPAVEPVAPRHTVQAQQSTDPEQPVATEPDAEPASVANDAAPQPAAATVVDGRPTPADPDLAAPRLETQPAPVESVVAPPTTAALPTASVPGSADATAPRPTYPRYLVVPEKIALQADRSFTVPAEPDPQPSTPAQTQSTATAQPQQAGGTAAVRPLPSTVSGGGTQARSQASPQGQVAPRQSRQPAAPRRGSTPPAETKPRIGSAVFPNLSHGIESLEGRFQRQPGAAESPAKQR